MILKHKILFLFFRFYKGAISPFLPQACRFFPTCSEYAYMATCDHGLIKGIVLTIKRLIRCHPWGGSGIDYPPKACTTPKHILNNKL